jgi:hypothetical protein
MPSWPRILLGFLIAPALVPATYAAFAAVTGGFLSLDLALQFGAFAYAAAVIAVPALLLLAHIGWSSLHDFVVFGFMMGFVGGALTVERPIPVSSLPLLAFYGLSGLVAAGGFWALARPSQAGTGP